MKRITYFTIYFENFAGKRQSMFKTLTNVLNQTLKIEVNRDSERDFSVNFTF